MAHSVANLHLRDLARDEAWRAADFFHRHWRNEHIFYRHPELLHWQYGQNPLTSQFSTGLTFKAAMAGDDLIGAMGYMPFVFNRFGERQFGCHLSAWWVHPDHRRGPMGMRLLNELQQRMPFDACVAATMTPISERLFRTLGWTSVPNLGRWVQVIDREGLFGLLAPEQTRTAAMQLAEGEGKRPIADAAITVTEVTHLDHLDGAAWDRFYWQHVAPSHLGPARETSYLRWRYQEIPFYRYHTLLATAGSEILGLLIFRAETVKDRHEIWLRLVDLVTGPEAAASLLAALYERAKALSAVAIDFFCSLPLFAAPLGAAGFVDARTPDGTAYWLPFLFQPLDHAHLRLNAAWWIKGMDLASPEARQFLLTKGDHEYDRPN
jgi:hypothetical protein